MTDKKPTLKKPNKGDDSPLALRLENFGLTRAEALIYMYLLERGIEAGGSKIAIGTRLHRQYVYLALPKLIEQGLVEETAYGKQHKYRARPPIEIEKLGRKRALEAGELARELNQISNIGNEQDFEVIQGVRAIQQYETNLVRSADESWECYIIGGATHGYSKIMGEQLNDHLDLMREKKLSVKYLGHASEMSFYDQYIGVFENQEYRFMEKLPQGVTHLVVRHDSVSFYSFLNPPLVYVIKSSIVAQNYKAFFDMLWKMAGEAK